MSDAYPTPLFPRPTHRLDKIEAHIFLDDCAALLADDHPEMFTKLLGALEAFYRDRDVQGLMIRIARTCFMVPELINALNTWLPPSCSLVYGEDENEAQGIRFSPFDAPLGPDAVPNEIS
ncbi:hypothetical protein PIIN_07585 [Serendipita indica DSM 11827]|uniref:Uncharacterized protein n=1 Tax=Serendipita indica (strain DSM 11827) TaxID=1109443 RepID=G4TQP3_SERID|nr:hypothetical protein PIIN_07585 [Serendipita indica DSM 11827]